METAYSPTQEALEAYLPATLVEHWARDPEQPSLWGHWLTGSLMFCDVSGFTAMSESLTRHGKEGAELMAAVLNQFFERMLAIADSWGGAQMKFGGDAMLLLFSGEQDAGRAAAAGLEMQSAMSSFRRLPVGGDTYKLRMRIAIHSGNFYGASVGQSQGTLHYLLVGRDVNRTAQIEGAGEPGQVVLSTEAVAGLGAECELAPGRQDVWRVRRLAPPARPPKSDPLVVPAGVLSRYLLPPLAEPLLAGRLPLFSGEHRRVVAVFINLLGISQLLESEGEAQALVEADIYVKTLIATMERYGGFLAGSDLSPEGDKLICLFGAPVSVERGEESALRAVLELDRELRTLGLSLRHRIGVNSGSVFAGEIGSRGRREYTVIGDSVNLAARLMAAARPGEILASRSTVERARATFRVDRLRPLRVKGKAAPVQVYRLRDTGMEEPGGSQAAQLASPLVGRDKELAELKRQARYVSSRGRSRCVLVWGEPGIGKSRLISECARKVQEDGWRLMAAACQPHTSNTPFSAWRGLLRAHLGIAADDTSEEAWQKLKSAVQRVKPELASFASLLMEVLSMPAVEDPLVASLDPKERRRHLTSIVVELVKAAGGDGPLLISFEDAHWADAPSLELLAAVLAHQEGRFLIVVTSRESNLPAQLAVARDPVSIHLKELSPEAAQSLIASAVGLNVQDVARIVARAQGNPLFLQEISRSGLVGNESLPETVNDVILSRIDRLPPEEKGIMRLAAVIGPSFELDGLRALAGSTIDPYQMSLGLGRLRDMGFTRQTAQEPPTYTFSHVLTREVAYETLPYAQRRQLHRRFAQHMEHRDVGRLEMACELLLHHYEMAGDAAKIARYALMSGDRATAVFATNEAIDHFQRSLSALLNTRKPLRSDRSVLLERQGDCLMTAGRYTEAAMILRESLEEWRASPRMPRLAKPAGRIRARGAELCRKVAVCFERQADYDQSLSWLEEALAALPRRSGRVGAQIHAAKSLALFRKGLYQDAINWARQGLALATSSGDRHEQAYAHQILAGPYMVLGKLRQALRHDRLSVRLYHKTNDLAGQARADSNLGLSYQGLGLLDGALYHYEMSLQANQRLGNVSHAAVARNNLAEVLLMQGDLDKAETHLNEVLRACREGNGRRDLAGLAEVNLSRCRLRRGDLDEAERSLGRGLRLLRGVGAEDLLTEALLHRVELRLARGADRKARGECRRLLIHSRALETTILEARAERLLGRAEGALGEIEPAYAHLRSSIAIARRASVGYEEAVSLVALARLLLTWPSRESQATKPLKRAIGILSTMGAQLDLAEAGQLLRVANEKPGRTFSQSSA